MLSPAKVFRPYRPKCGPLSRWWPPWKRFARNAIGTPTTVATATGSSSLSLAPTLSASVTAGNLLIVSVGCQISTSVTVTDSQSQTYSQAFDTGLATARGLCFYVANSVAMTSGVDTITVTFGTATPCAMAADQCSGIATTTPLDVAVTATGVSTAPDSGNTAATAQAAELAWGVCAYHWAGSSTTATATGSYTKLDTQTSAGGAGVQMVDEYLVLASTGVQHAGFTLGASESWAQGIACFKGAGGGGGGGPRMLATLGVGT